MNFVTVIIFFGIVIGIALLVNHYAKRKTPIAVRFPVKFVPGQNIINLTDKEQYKVIFAPSSLNTPIGDYPSYTLQSADGTLMVIPQLTIENNDFVLVTEGNTAADPLIGLGASLEVNLAHDSSKPFYIDLSTKPAVAGTASVNTIRGTLSVTIPDGPTFESLVGQPGVTPDWLVTDITNRIIGLTALATDEEDTADRKAAFEELERQMVKTTALRQSSEDGQLNVANANQIYSVLQQVERSFNILTQRAKANNPDLDALIGECLDSSAQVDPNSSKIDLSPSGSLGRHAMTIHTPTLYAAVVADMKALSDERDALAKEQPEGTVDKPAAPDFWLPTQLSVAINDLAVFINSVIHAEQQSGGLIDEVFVKSVAETPINIKLANCDKAFSDIVAATHFSSTDIPKEWPSAVINVPVALSAPVVMESQSEPARVDNSDLNALLSKAIDLTKESIALRDNANFYIDLVAARDATEKESDTDLMNADNLIDKYLDLKNQYGTMLAASGKTDITKFIIDLSNLAQEMALFIDGIGDTVASENMSTYLTSVTNMAKEAIDIAVKCMKAEKVAIRAAGLPTEKARGKDLLQLNLSELVRKVTYAALTASDQPKRTPEELAALVNDTLGEKQYSLLEKIITSTSLEQDLAVAQFVLKEYLLKLQNMRAAISSDAERIAFNELVVQMILTAKLFNENARTKESEEMLVTANDLALSRIGVLLATPATLAEPPPMIDLQFGGPVGFSPEQDVVQTSATEPASDTEAYRTWVADDANRGKTYPGDQEAVTESKVAASTPGMREIETNTIGTPVVKRPRRPRGNRPSKDKSSY